MSKKYLQKFKSIVISVFMIAISAVLITQVQAHAASTVPGVNNLVSVNGVNGQGGNGESRTCGISGDGNTI